MEAEREESTGPLRRMMRSIRRREKMSWVRQPEAVVSVTMGVGVQD